MKIYLISCSNESVLNVKCDTKEKEIEFFMQFLLWVEHLKIDQNKHVVWNVLFKKDDGLLRKVQGFCASPNGGNGKINDLYGFVNKVKDGCHFICIPIEDDSELSERDHIKIFVNLASLDSGVETESLIVSFNNFKEKVSAYFDIIAIYDADSMKTYIGHKKPENRECRFCGKSITHGGAHFDQEAHALSEFLGNKNLILCDECDECNGVIFAEIESELAMYLSPLKALMSIKGKKGFPSHVESGLLVETISSGHINIKIAENLVSKQEQDGVLKIKFDASAGKITPQNVYKIFSKYAISVLSDQYFCRDEFKALCDWIISDKYIEKLPLMCTQTNGKKSNEPSIAVYKRKEDVSESDMPKYLCELNAVGTRYLYELPLIEEDVCLDSIQKWHEFLSKVQIFGVGTDNSCMDFSGQDRVPCCNHIIFEGRECANQGSGLVSEGAR